nr:copia protein [Tanacetum cinerariifolium]
MGSNRKVTTRLARNANPLALVATAQANQDPYYHTSKSQKSYAPSSKPLIPTRSHTPTRYKGKEIAKPITPPSELASEEDSDPEQAQRDKDMQKNFALIAKYFKKIYKPTNNNLTTSSNSRNKNVDTTPRYKNDNQSRQFGNQRTMHVVGARKNVASPIVQQSGIQKNMLLCKQAEKGVPLQAEQYDWLPDMDEEIKEQELEAHYSYMTKIQELPTEDADTDSEPLEQGSSFELTAFSDVDHAGCIDYRQSTFGGIQFLGDKLVSWMSKKQNCIAMSSALAEYVALSASCAQVMWMRTQLQDYGFNYNKIPLYCNSRTEYQLADMFTKALPKDRFKYLVRRIGMRCLTLAELEVLAKESA